MNQAQMAQQIQHKLQTVVWPSGAGEVVFGAQKGVVEVFTGPISQDQMPPGRGPWCFIAMGSGDPDDDAPGLTDQTFQLFIGVASAGNPYGGHGLIGGPVQNLGKSPNRGVAEVMSRVLSAVGDIDGSDGASMQVTATSTNSPFFLGSMRGIPFAEVTVTAWCTSDLFYAPPQELVVTAASPDTWVWQGAHCSDRFDFLNYVLVGKDGGAFPQTVTDGTVIYTGVPANTTHDPNLANYSLFAQYDDRGDGTADGNSDPGLVGARHTI